MKTTSVSTTKTSARTVRSAKDTKQLVTASGDFALGDVNFFGEAKQAVSPQELAPEFLPDLASVEVTDTTVTCSFVDGHTVSFPLQWSAKLSRATPNQQQAFDFNAHFIFWDEIDEIIGVRNILLGKQLNWQ